MPRAVPLGKARVPFTVRVRPDILRLIDQEALEKGMMPREWAEWVIMSHVEHYSLKKIINEQLDNCLRYTQNAQEGVFKLDGRVDALETAIATLSTVIKELLKK